MLPRKCLLLFVMLVLAPWAKASAGEQILENIVARCPAIAARRELDHRIVLYKEKPGAEEVIHVYLTLAHGFQPYSFSLGWLTVAGNDEKSPCLDECNEQIHALAEKKNSPGFNKANCHNTKGFDFVSCDDMKSALSQFAEATKDKAAGAKIHNNFGACLAFFGQYKQAEEELNAALKLKPDYAAAIANRSCLFLAQGKDELSLSASKQALKLDPFLKPARFAAIQSQLRLGQLDDATALAADTAKHYPDDPDAAVLIGDCFYAQGDLKTARKQYQKALTLLPNDIQILLKAADAAQICGDLDDALKKARQATLVKPLSAPAHLALGRYLEMNREDHAAQIQFERALDTKPDPATKLSIYGPYLRVLVNMAALDQADKLSKKWCLANAKSANCHYNRAWILSQMPNKGNIQQAIDEYQNALKINQDLVQSHYNLALLFVKAGNNKEAAQELKTFIQEAHQDPDIGNAQKLLDLLVSAHAVHRE